MKTSAAVFSIISLLYTAAVVHAAPTPTIDEQQHPFKLTKSGPDSSAYASLDWQSVEDTNKGSESDFHTYNKNNDPVRGVNLGGWLLLEPWINTDLFSTEHFSDGKIPEDEFNFVERLGYDAAGKLLEKHYESWITEGDFDKIQSYGLNAVRIPIGYWAYKLMSTDKYYKGSQDRYLEKALGWAKDRNLKVWIDLHGAPGSQNGYDSSGHKGFHDWSKYNNLAETKEVLDYLMAKYGGATYKDTIIGIELLNEPLVGGDDGVTQDYLSDFYADVIDSARNKIKIHQNIVLHDGYLWQGAWSGKPYNSDSKLLYDTHTYVLYDETLKQKSYEEKLDQVCTWGNDIGRLDYKEIAGEFTAAWDADSNSVYTGKIDTWSDEDKAKISRFVQAEFNAFDRNYGWFFWNWKMGDSDQWDYQALTENGVIPNPISSRTYDDCK